MRSSITKGTEPHACLEVENYAALFSWSALLAAWIAGTCAQQRKTMMTTSRNMAMQPWITAYIFDIGNPC